MGRGLALGDRTSILQTYMQVGGSGYQAEADLRALGTEALIKRELGV